MSLLVLTNNTSSININPPEVITLEIGLTPAGARGLQGLKGDKGSDGQDAVVANELGQSESLVVSQKLLTDAIGDIDAVLINLNGV